MVSDIANVVLAHGAWADGSSWNKVITGLRARGIASVAAPLPLTTLADDVAALDRTLERVDAPVVLVGHAYAGAVIAETKSEKVKSLVYVTALAPDEGEKVTDVFYRKAPHPKAPKLSPDRYGLIYLPHDAFAAAFAQRRNFSGKQSLTTKLRGVRRRMKSSFTAVRVLTTKSGRDLTKRREPRQKLSV